MSKYVTFPLNDTEYTAEDMALYFSGRTSGVYPQTGELDVLTNGNKTVTITKGRAWISYSNFKGVIFGNMEDLTLTVEIADGILDRIDRVVIRLDIVENNSYIYIKKGVPSSSPVPPSLERGENTAWELCLADIYVGKGTTTIRPQDVTDRRLDANLCGIVSDGITNVSTTVINNSFNDWFESVKSILDEDIAISLQSQIKVLDMDLETEKSRVDEIENIGLRIKNTNTQVAYFLKLDNDGLYLEEV